MQQFPEIAVALKNAGALRPLDPLLQLQDRALQQRRKGEHSQHLRDLQQNIPRAHRERSPRMAKKAPLAMRTDPPDLSETSPGVISHRGGYTANPIATGGKERRVRAAVNAEQSPAALTPTKGEPHNPLSIAGEERCDG